MIPHSPHGDAWGVTRIPIAVISNGSGPTVILEGGNHGDEYEGPITICELIRDLDPGEIQGRLILMPANNVHAVMAGKRTSPVDGLNFNRTFPGDPQGTITQQISAYIARDFSARRRLSRSPLRRLVARHSSERRARADRRSRSAPAQCRGGARLRCTADRRHQQYWRFAHRDCRRLKAGLTTSARKWPAAARCHPEVLDLCRRGVRNVLAHLGVIAAAATTSASRDRAPLYRAAGTQRLCFCNDATASSSPFTQWPAGEGWRGGRAHPLHLGSGARARHSHYQADGILYGRRQPGRVRPGNCCLVVAAPYDGDID